MQSCRKRSFRLLRAFGSVPPHRNWKGLLQNVKAPARKHSPHLSTCRYLWIWNRQALERQLHAHEVSPFHAQIGRSPLTGSQGAFSLEHFTLFVGSSDCHRITPTGWQGITYRNTFECSVAAMTVTNHDHWMAGYITGCHT